MTTPEGEIAAALHRTGTRFLRFYRVLLRGEVQEENIGRENAEMVQDLRSLARVVRERVKDLRFGTAEPVKGTGPSLATEIGLLGKGLELTARKMETLEEAVPSMEESDSLLPLKPLRDLLNDFGRGLLAVASGMEEAELVLSSEPADLLHLARLESRLVQHLVELGQLQHVAREMMTVAAVELRLSANRKP